MGTSQKMQNSTEMKNFQQSKNCIIYFDGGCPLCAKEIATYQKWRGADRIEWIDASKCTEEELGDQLDRSQALAKLHVRQSDGTLVSGSAAFVALWQNLNALNWFTRFLNNALMIRCLDFFYALFLQIRPIWRRHK